MRYPLLVFIASLTFLVLATWIGDALRRRAGPPKGEERTDAALLLSATLTLLYFIIGFTFSMAINRYDLRKTCELTEALSIGTAHSRADLLAPADAAKFQSILKNYLDQRLLFYTTRNLEQRSGIAKETVRLQMELWATVRTAIVTVPPPLMGLLVSTTNDLVNSQRSSQAAWINRIPTAAWVLMSVIAVGNCWLIGYRARRTDWLAFLIVPFAASVCFFLVSDLDSPVAGAIRVYPQNLTTLTESLGVR